MTEPKRLWTAAEIAAASFDFRHPLQPESAVGLAGLSRLAGMTRSGVNLARIAPGKQAFPLHSHRVEEEWVFVVSGAAEIRIGEARHDLGPGGFVAFAPGGPAHAVVNASAAEDLVCLMGGDAVAAEIVDFPELGKRIVRTGAENEIVSADAFEPFDFFAATRPPGKPG